MQNSKLRLFVSLMLMGILGSPLVNAQERVEFKSDDDSFEYIDKIYEISYESVHGLNKIKGTLNDYPITAVYENCDTGVSLTSFSATNMFENGIIEESDIIVHCKSFNGGKIPSGSVVVLKSISFGGFQRYRVKAMVVDNCNLALSVGKKFFLGDVSVKKNTIEVRIHEKSKID